MRQVEQARLASAAKHSAYHAVDVWMIDANDGEIDVILRSG
jgi:hypothetical protein